jgi:hypothetical protein
VGDSPVYKIYPSDLTWLYASCPRCFALKLKHKVGRPEAGFPQIFSKIDSAIKKHCLALERTELVCAAMPKGRFLADAPKSVLSRRFSIAGLGSSFELRGKPDALVEWDTGGYGVIDFKTSAIRAGNVGNYGNQLEIYASALEQPAGGRPALEPIGEMGLLVWEPELFSAALAGVSLNLSGQLAWIPVPRRRDELRNVLRGMLAVLDSDGLPPPADGCKFCSYPGALQALITAG